MRARENKILATKEMFGFCAGFGRLLAQDDIPKLRTLCEKCSDVAVKLTGKPPDVDAASKLLAEVVVRGESLAKGFCIGIFDSNQSLIGLMAVHQNSPAVGDWYIGNFMLEPSARSRGYGGDIFNAFQRYVLCEKGRRILLAVMHTNRAAQAFWIREGFEPIRELSPIQFGNLLQTGTEFCKLLDQ